jgi:hypothetical protein
MGCKRKREEDDLESPRQESGHGAKNTTFVGEFLMTWARDPGEMNTAGSPAMFMRKSYLALADLFEDEEPLDDFLPPPPPLPPREVRTVALRNPTAKKAKYMIAAWVSIFLGMSGGREKLIVDLLFSPTMITNKSRTMKKIVLKSIFAFISARDSMETPPHRQ